MIRVLIADDELPARQRLRELLVSHPEFEVVGEADTGARAMELVAGLQPDLLLLDIQMPEGTGLDIAACLPTPRPHIIFCTAFDQHAVDAFELKAVDYLLKPVSRLRLGEALARLPRCPPEAADSNVDQLLRDSKQRLSRFLVQSDSRYLVIPASETAYFESVDGLTKLVTRLGKSYWIDPSLQELETRVDPSIFSRISRSALINLNAVAEVHPFPGGSAAVRLKNGVSLEVSRRRFKELLHLLQGG